LAGGFPVETAEDGAAFRQGRLYLPRADEHLLLSPATMVLRRGPRENLMRPAIDPLFRSAAVYHGPRVIGVVLTGTLGDGSAGLAAIKRCGGIAVVQDPADAAFAEMPLAALAAADVDHTAPLSDMAPLLARLVAQKAGPALDVPPDLRWEVGVAEGRVSAMDEPSAFGQQTQLSCPDCNGPLWEMAPGDLPRFRCYQGHAYGPEALLNAQERTLEQALWSALRAHRERAALVRRLAQSARQSNRLQAAAAWEKRAAEHEGDAELIRRLLRTDITQPTAPSEPEARRADA
jgi:two-component system chemotaxis response regulator CheB